MADKLRKAAIVSSSIWASYGDALGFISELIDRRTLKQRIRSEEISQTIGWRRNVGGRFGTTVDMPSGSYSDDTQLRLATSRAIRADGYFDVEAFAKIELPVWRSYALGAGRGTKAAASSLCNPHINWFSNFFKSKDLSYLEGGGNGAAMRIQPHVWANCGSAVEPVLRDVVRNCVTTHGHVRAIAGACFHALSLQSTIQSGYVPGIEQWRDAVESLTVISEIIRSDRDLNAFWLPVWEDRSKVKLADALKEVQRECESDIDRIEPHLSEPDRRIAYGRMAMDIGAFRAESRGSGIKTAILASALSWLYRNDNPNAALIAAANLLGSDTDTIATMAGALLGAHSLEPLKPDLLDREYISEEAGRLFEVSAGVTSSSFDYPDLLKWIPPKTMLDSVRVTDGAVSIAGLGSAEPIGQEWQSRKGDDTAWQWMRLCFGQTILVRQRKTLVQVDPANLNELPSHRKSGSDVSRMKKQNELFEPDGGRDVGDFFQVESATLDVLTTEAIKSKFSHEVIGRHLMSLAERPDGIELSIAYAAVLAKARRARLEAQLKEQKPVATVGSK